MPRKDVAALEAAIRDLGDAIYSMTNKEIAQHLGKNPDTISIALRRMGIERNAYKIAGERQRATHGHPGRWLRCDCETCTEAKRSYKRAEYLRHRESLTPEERQQALEASRAALAQRQARTTARAKSSGRRWTGPEVEQAIRDDVPIEQIASQLGRTYAAISNVRKALANPADPAHIRYKTLLGYDPYEQ